MRRDWVYEKGLPIILSNKRMQ